MAQAMSNTGKCKLCNRDRALQKSHVVPRFIRKRTKATSAVENPRYFTGEGGSFRKLEQDLPKEVWLCLECEQLLSRSEKIFSETVYQAIWNGHTVSGRSHEEHVHRFVVSMAWRTWHWYNEHHAELFNNISNADRLREAEHVWRMYLLGKRSDVGDFKQHMLVQSGQIANSAGHEVPLHGYYWDRGVNLDLLGDGRSMEKINLVHTKIPKIAMFGTVEKDKSSRWRGTLVEPGLGDTWSGQKATVPDAMLQYMRKQGEKVLAILDEVPVAVKDKTRERMDSLVEKERDDYLKRDAVRSLVADDLMELPEESIVSDALNLAANSSDARGQKMAEALGRLSEAEMKSLHRETNRIGLRCKALNLEERFSLLADGREEVKEPGKAILVGVEVYRTRERAMEKSRLLLFLGVDSEEVTIAIGADSVPVGNGDVARGIRYLK